MVDLARHSIMHALIAALLLGSHSVATATATVQSAPGSIFLAHAFVGNQAQQELLHNEFYCVSTDSSKPPKALEELRKRCSTNPAYKILMRLLATVPGEKPPSRKVSLLEYVNSYQSTFANLLTSLDPIKLNDRLNRLRKFEATKSYGEEQKKAARQELVGSEVYKELKKSFKDNVIDEVVDKILSLNYLDYAKETVKSAYLRLGKDLSGDDFMDDDDALKGVFKQLGPVLTLSEVLSCKRTQDFYVNLVGQDDHWLTGYGSVVKRIFSIMNYMYMQMPTDDFDKVIKECEKVRLQAIDLVSKQKTITEKLKTISDQEKEIIKAIELATVTLKAPQWIQAFNDFKAALEEVHKKTIDQSQQKHENIYIARELRLNKPRTLDIVAQSEDVQMSPSMYYVLNSEDLLNGILNPAGWKTKISSLANPNDPFSKRLFELVKDLNIDVKAMQLDRAHSVNLPTILLPQTIMLAEHESWRFSLQDHLYKEELTHADRVKLYKALQELSGVKDKVAAPSLAIYELDGEISRDRLTDIIASYSGRFFKVHKDLHPALYATLQSNRAPSNAGAVKKSLAALVDKASEELKQKSKACRLNGVKARCIDYAVATKILHDLDQAAVEPIKSLGPEGEKVVEVLGQYAHSDAASIKAALQEVTKEFAASLSAAPKRERKASDDGDGDGKDAGDGSGGGKEKGKEDSADGAQPFSWQTPLIATIAITVVLGILITLASIKSN